MGKRPAPIFEPSTRWLFPAIAVASTSIITPVAVIPTSTTAPPGATRENACSMADFAPTVTKT